MQWETPQDRVEPAAAAEVIEDAERAFALIEQSQLSPFIESQYRGGATPVGIASALSELHGVRIQAVIIQQWVTEEIRVRDAITRNPLVREYVREHAEELSEQIGGDLSAIDQAAGFLREVVVGESDALSIEVSADERLRQRVKAARELANVLKIKYELTGEPITPKRKTAPVSDLRTLALEIYGTQPPKR